MDVAAMIAGIGLTLFLAKLAEELILRLGVPGLIGPLIVGMFLSNTPLKSEYSFSPFLFLVGLSFATFLLGAGELAFRVTEVDKTKLIKGVILFIVPFVVALLMLIPFIDWRYAFLLSAAMAMTSTPRIYGILSHAGLVHEAGELLIASSVTELTGLIAIQYFTTYNIVSIVAIIIFLIIFIKVGKRLIRLILKIEEDFIARELPLSLLISTTVAISYIAEVFGLNNAVMSLLLGVVAGEYLAERPWIKRKYAIITHSFFEPLFFVGAGMNVSIVLAFHVLVIIIATNFVVALVKVITGNKLGWSTKLSLATNLKGGIDSAVLASAWRRGVLPLDLYSSAILTITLNTLILSIMYRNKIVKRGIKVCELQLDRAALDPSDPLTIAYEMLRNREAVVVVDIDNWPIGYVTAADLLKVPFEELDKWRVIDVYREGIPVIHCEEPLYKILFLFEEEEADPVIAVVKEHIGYVGSIYPLQAFRALREL